MSAPAGKARYAPALLAIPRALVALGLLIFVLLIAPSPAQAAISADTSGNCWTNGKPYGAQRSSSSGGTLNCTLGMTADRTNRLVLLVLDIAGTTATGSSVTDNGRPLTLIASQRAGDGTHLVEIWALVGPDAGTNAVTYTLSAAAAHAVTIIALSGVDQTNPFRSVQTASVANGKSLSVTLATSANDWIISSLVQNTGSFSRPSGSTTYQAWSNPSSWVTQNLPTSESVTMNLTSAFSGNGGLAAVSIAPHGVPLLQAGLTSSTLNDPVRGTVNPLAIPGALVMTSTSVTNAGSGSPDANSTAITIPVPANMKLYVGDLGSAGSGPVLFAQGATPSGLSYAFTALSSTTDGVEFSNDGGATWTYVPTPDAQQGDPAITTVRVKLSGTFTVETSPIYPSFTVSYGLLVK